MPEATLQEWLDYLPKEDAYNSAIKEYVAALQRGENPTKPLPTKPPAFTGFEGE